MTVKKGKAKPSEKRTCIVCGHPVAEELQNYCELHAQMLQLEIKEEMQYHHDAEKFQKRNV